MGFLSGLTGGDEASKAAKLQAKGYSQAEGIVTRAGDEANLYQMPFYKSGTDALGRIDNAMAGDYSQFYQSPDYQFAFDEGQRAVDSSGAARGMALSGAQAKALTKYGQGAATQNYQNWLGNNMNLTNMGFGAGSNISNNIFQTGQSRAQNRLGQFGAKASGYLAKGGIKNSLFNTALGVGLSYLPKPGG